MSEDKENTNSGDPDMITSDALMTPFERVEESKNWHERLIAARVALATEPEIGQLSKNCVEMLESINTDAGSWTTCACGEKEAVLFHDRNRFRGPWDQTLEKLGVAFSSQASKFGDRLTLKRCQRAYALSVLKKMEKLQQDIQKRAAELLIGLADQKIEKVPRVNVDDLPKFILQKEYDVAGLRALVYGIKKAEA